MPAPNTPAAVQACTAAVALANTDAVSFTCVAGGDTEGCLELISQGGAELATVGGAPLSLCHCGTTAVARPALRRRCRA